MSLTPEKEATDLIADVARHVAMARACEFGEDSESTQLILRLRNSVRDILSAISTEREGRERAEAERDIALKLHQDALRLAGVDQVEAYEIGRGLRPSPFESGWLIEGWVSQRNEFKAEWWSLELPESEDGQGWTKDSSLALRFARERDAQDYINDIGWTEAKPTEHGWGVPQSVRAYRDQISALQAQIAEKDEALRPFAEYFDLYERYRPAEAAHDPFPVICFSAPGGFQPEGRPHCLSMHRFRRARTALNSTEAKTGKPG